jgi:phage-related protein
MKDVRFCGRYLDVLRDFPADTKREAGYQLDRVQHGLGANRLEADAVDRIGCSGDPNHA